MSGRVLVVEDDQEIREILAEVLIDQGYLVETATNGREALDRIHACRPCVMLLDLMMPVMDGWELLTELEAEGSVPSLPVVVVSAAHEAEPPKGVRRYLRKPVPIERLLEAVKTYCG
jgi:CheY-like chemotaxis protein